MKNAHIIVTLIFALVLAQGLRLCVHTPVAGQVETFSASLVHYESDSNDFNFNEDGLNLSLAWHMPSVDPFNMLTGLSAIALLLILLLQFTRGGRSLVAYPPAVPVLAEGSRFRPPLRAPPR